MSKEDNEMAVAVAVEISKLVGAEKLGDLVRAIADIGVPRKNIPEVIATLFDNERVRTAVPALMKMQRQGESRDSLRKRVKQGMATMKWKTSEDDGKPSPSKQADEFLPPARIREATAFINELTPKDMEHIGELSGKGEVVELRMQVPLGLIDCFLRRHEHALADMRFATTVAGVEAIKRLLAEESAPPKEALN